MLAFGKHSLPYPLQEQPKKMWILRRLLKAPLTHRLFSFLAAQYIRLVFVTSRWTYLGTQIPEAYLKAQKPFIFCFWHGRLGMMVYAWTWKDRPFHMLMSAHRDGRLISQTIAYFGIAAIVGSTRRGGAQALRSLLKALRAGDTIGITPDGPRGPCQVASPGVITIAKLAQADMVPVTFSTSRRIRLKTWDRFHMPLPFSRGVFLWGEPVPPPSENDPSEIEAARQRLEAALTDLQDKADDFVSLAAP
jgi:lysophospholipid acyltransferase (LPLAT)-like uncharacterized protein